MYFKKLLGCLLIVLVSGCVPMCDQQPPVQPLRCREAQTRNFESTDSRTVMKAMINVLQDEGYIVKNAVVELGLLTAEKDVNVPGYCDPYCSDWFFCFDDRYPNHALVELTANISEYGDDTRVRVNFQKRVFDNYGCVIEANQEMSEQHYREFFAKVSRGVFFQIENL